MASGRCAALARTMSAARVLLSRTSGVSASATILIACLLVHTATADALPDAVECPATYTQAASLPVSSRVDGTGAASWLLVNATCTGELSVRACADFPVHLGVYNTSGALGLSGCDAELKPAGELQESERCSSSALRVNVTLDEPVLVYAAAVVEHLPVLRSGDDDVIAVVCLPRSAARCTDCHVASSTGSDSSGDGSVSAPLASVMQAAAVPGVEAIILDDAGPHAIIDVILASTLSLSSSVASASMSGASALRSAITVSPAAAVLVDGIALTNATITVSRAARLTLNATALSSSSALVLADSATLRTNRASLASVDIQDAGCNSDVSMTDTQLVDAQLTARCSSWLLSNVTITGQDSKLSCIGGATCTLTEASHITDAGNVLLASAGAVVTLTGGTTVDSCGASDGVIRSHGGAIVLAGGAAITRTSAGRAVELAGPTALLDMHNASIADGADGAVSLHAGAAAVLSGGAVIARNAAAASGGAVLLASGASVNLTEDAALHSNSAAVDGGAVAAADDASRVTISGTVRITACSAGRDGGGIAVAAGAMLTLDADFVVLDSNTAGRDGGAVYVGASAAAVLLDGAVISNCTAKASGGGVALHASASILNTNITQCVAQDGVGGAIAAASHRVLLACTNVYLESNRADVGGGVGYVRGAALTVEAAAWRSNIAAMAGAVLGQAGDGDGDASLRSNVTIVQSTMAGHSGSLLYHLHDDEAPRLDAASTASAGNDSDVYAASNAVRATLMPGAPIFPQGIDGAAINASIALVDEYGRRAHASPRAAVALSSPSDGAVSGHVHGVTAAGTGVALLPHWRGVRGRVGDILPILVSGAAANDAALSAAGAALAASWSNITLAACNSGDHAATLPDGNHECRPCGQGSIECGGACVACPDVAVCNGARIQARRGYYLPEPPQVSSCTADAVATSVYRCPLGRCLGGNRCVDSRAGALCTFECASGRIAFGKTRCLQPEQCTWLGAAVAHVAWALAVVCVAVVLVAPSAATARARRFRLFRRTSASMSVRRHTPPPEAGQEMLGVAPHRDSRSSSAASHPSDVELALDQDSADSTHASSGLAAKSRRVLCWRRTATTHALTTSLFFLQTLSLVLTKLAPNSDALAAQFGRLLELSTGRFIAHLSVSCFTADTQDPDAVLTAFYLHCALPFIVAPIVTAIHMCLGRHRPLPSQLVLCVVRVFALLYHLVVNVSLEILAPCVTVASVSRLPSALNSVDCDTDALTAARGVAIAMLVLVGAGVPTATLLLWRRASADVSLHSWIAGYRVTTDAWFGVPRVPWPVLALLRQAVLLVTLNVVPAELIGGPVMRIADFSGPNSPPVSLLLVSFLILFLLVTWALLPYASAPDTLLDIVALLALALVAAVVDSRVLDYLGSLDTSWITVLVVAVLAVALVAVTVAATPLAFADRRRLPRVLRQISNLGFLDVAVPIGLALLAILVNSRSLQHPAVVPTRAHASSVGIGVVAWLLAVMYVLAMLREGDIVARRDRQRAKQQQTAQAEQELTAIGTGGGG